MIVLLSAEAERDLEEIGDYISRDNPRRALTFIADLRDACFGLADFPNRFPIVPRYADVGLRCRAYGRYAIFYVVGNDRVTIIHILHSARDYDMVLGDGETGFSGN